jgi:uncharacterized surface protein with fasciclin (FAS1) repeats
MTRKIALIALLTSVLVLAGVCMAADMKIMDTANATANLTEFVGAVETAGLTDTLNTGTFTVFAPSNEAFFNIAPEDYKALLESPTELKSVLTYHVVEGKMMLSDLKDGQELTTVQGEKLTVKVGSDKTVTVNGAKITEADITASNGIIHIIDTVLMPK